MSTFDIYETVVNVEPKLKFMEKSFQTHGKSCHVHVCTVSLGDITM